MSEDKGGTIAKGMRVLRAVGEFPHGAPAGEIAAACDFPFSTAYRLLGSLVQTGFVTFEPRTKLYALGLPVFELGQRVANARGFDGTALPVLRELTAATGESAILAIRDGDQTLTIHTVDGPEFRITTDPGDRGPLHTSGIGKMLLAAMPPAERAAMLDELDLTPRTPHSVPNRAALETQLDVAAEQGWVVQSQEHDVGMNAIAVPVLRAGGSVVAALALAAPVFRADADALVAHVPALQRAAATLAATLP